MVRVHFGPPHFEVIGNSEEWRSKGKMKTLASDITLTDNYLFTIHSYFLLQTWGFSSAGRAPALQAGGQRFDPANLHQINLMGTRVRAVSVKIPNRTVILGSSAHWRENPPDIQRVICRALLPKASILGIATPVMSVAGSQWHGSREIDWSSNLGWSFIESLVQKKRFSTAPWKLNIVMMMQLWEGNSKENVLQIS